MLLLLACSSPAQAWARQALLPVAELRIGAYTVQAEIAANEASRNHGLMNRQDMPRDHGMLFVFERPGRVCFWMKNTPLPLTIAFLDEDGRIINLADMQPHTLGSHCPAADMRYALEMHQGWFRQRGIGPGTPVSGLPGTRTGTAARP